MVKDSHPPSASSSSDSYLYPPMPPDVTQILLNVLDPVLGGSNNVWVALSLSSSQKTGLCRHVEMRSVRDNEGEERDEFYRGS